MTLRTVISVGLNVAPYQGRADYFDGLTPVPEPVSLSFADESSAKGHDRGQDTHHGTGPALVIARRGGEPLRWPLGSLRALPGRAGADDGLILGVAGGGAARLMLDSADTALIRARAHRLDHRFHPSRWRRATARILGAVLCIGVMIGVLGPAVTGGLARGLPTDVRSALGDQMQDRIRRALDPAGDGVPLCTAPEGMAALRKIAARLGAATAGPGSVPESIRVSVLDQPEIIALSLPGGRVVLFRGVIQAAASAEEVAAVLAHALGHISGADPTRRALGPAGFVGGLGLNLADAAGGRGAPAVVTRVVAARHAPWAEAAARADAVARLAAAGVALESGRGFVDGLARAEDGPAPALRHYLPTTPPPSGTAPGPLLSGSEWAALRATCTGNGPDGSGA